MNNFKLNGFSVSAEDDVEDNTRLEVQKLMKNWANVEIEASKIRQKSKGAYRESIGKEDLGSILTSAFPTQSKYKKKEEIKEIESTNDIEEDLKIAYR